MTIDELLAMTIDRKASDLHLRCGEPPTIRRDGLIERVGDLERLTEIEIRAMIEATIPERNGAAFELTATAITRTSWSGARAFASTSSPTGTGRRPSSGRSRFAS